MKLRRPCANCGKLLTERDAAVKLPHTGRFFCDANCLKMYKRTLAPQDQRRLECEQRADRPQLTALV